MRTAAGGESDVAAAAEPASQADRDPLRRLAARFPRPARFLAVGGCGLIADLGIFTYLAGNGLDPLVARLFSLAGATLVTWRLNRALTFERSERRQSEEAMRYGAVTVTAQSTSYAVFAGLVLMFPALLPQAALLIGAAGGAFISYNGHRLFAFAPRENAPQPKS